MGAGVPDEGNGLRRKDFWDKVAAIGLGTIAVAFVGGVYTWAQTRQQGEARRQELFTQMLTQRERADSDLRVAMFKTMLDGYFEGRAGALEKASGPGSDPTSSPDAISRKIMFLDLLGRNFETMDMAPLFEDLDARLSGVIDKSARREDQGLAFRQRERLRQVARALAAGQVRALSTLKGTTTQRVTVRACGERHPEVRSDDGDSEIARVLEVRHMRDGRVRIRLDAPTGGAGFKVPPEFQVSFYDMPYIDNSRLSSETRVAVVLEKYVSPNGYRNFLDEIEDKGLQADYRELIKRADTCDRAVIQVVRFPENYLGLRDRPYLEEVLSRIQGDTKAR